MFIDCLVSTSLLHVMQSAETSPLSTVSIVLKALGSWNFRPDLGHGMVALILKHTHYPEVIVTTDCVDPFFFDADYLCGRLCSLSLWRKASKFLGIGRVDGTPSSPGRAIETCHPGNGSSCRKPFACSTTLRTRGGRQLSHGPVSFKRTFSWGRWGSISVKLLLLAETCSCCSS